MGRKGKPKASITTLAAVCNPLPLCAANFAVTPPSAPPALLSSSTVGSISPSLGRFELTWSLHLRRCFRRWSGSSLVWFAVAHSPMISLLCLLLFLRCLHLLLFLRCSLLHRRCVASAPLLLCSVLFPLVRRLC
ncbi:hypothetical protein U1Q18_029497 [Sarracenia purpurea var. burkii]